MVAALKRHRDKPVMYLGDTTLTGGEVAERISQYVQAFEALGAGHGTPAALLALNRPEVLFILGAGQTQGYRRTSLHPLGSLDDHAYVINDAGITTLIIDPVRCSSSGRSALLEKCPGLTQVLTIGPVPEELADVGKDLVADRRDVRAAAARGAVLAAGPHRLDHLHRRHHRQAQGRDRHVAGDDHDDPDPAGRVGVARVAALPDVHAAVARRRRVLRADGDQGRVALRAAALRPGRGAADDRGAEDHRHDAGALDALRADGPPRLAHPRPVVARDRLLRRLGDQPGAAGGGDRAVRADLRPVLRPVRGADGDQLPRQGRPRRRSGSSSCGRPSAFLRTALLGEDGKPVPAGEPGEICVAGPLLAGGYWNLPDETAETFRDGWMHTGDVAREDEDGFWFIVDRTKDMIVTGGFNVFPREVEDVVAEHPAVAQVGVIGVPDERWGEAVTAIVVLREGARAHRRGRRRDQGDGQGAQGRGAGAQAGDRHRRAAADRARQAGQEGPAGAVLDRATASRLASRYADLTRDELALLVPELLLIGHLIDRSGMAWCIEALGREGMAEVAIDEWMAASPIYTPADAAGARLRQGDDVITIFKGLQLDIGAPPQFMDFRYTVHDPWHGEFHLDHCGALMDVEPMGEDYVVSMCHDIEDPTFDATAVATNPKAQIRPIHRPPRVAAGPAAALRVDGDHRRVAPAGPPTPRAAGGRALGRRRSRAGPDRPRRRGCRGLRRAAALRPRLRRLLALRAGPDGRRGVPADAPAEPRLPRTASGGGSPRTTYAGSRASSWSGSPGWRRPAPRGPRHPADRRRQRAPPGPAPGAQPARLRRGRRCRRRRVAVARRRARRRTARSRTWTPPRSPRRCR